VRDVTRACLIALAFSLLVAPQALGATALAYLAATCVFLVLNLTLAYTWDRANDAPGSIKRVDYLVAASVGLVAALLVVAACHRWFLQILTYPNDAQRADMLVVIQQGIRRVLQGRNPYTIYHVPWEVTLPYGPVMWAPYVVPHVLHVDVRFVSLIGELFVPVATTLTAIGLAWSGHVRSALAMLVLLAGMAFSPDLYNFAPIAHTPSYWPLLAAFAWVVTRDRWDAAALLAGLLIVARTTMVAIAPVVLMAVWFRDRPRTVRAAIILVTTALLPYLPFAVWDWTALKYALYGSYQSLMKGFVWTSTPWARDTIGVTGLLLRLDWKRLVEPAQVVAMLVIYACAWRALANGRRPLPGMALALLVFSMTSLWPVHYIYLDVLLLWASAALAETSWLESRRLLPVWTSTLTLSILLLAAMAWANLSINPTVDVGSPVDRVRLYAGFADDEHGDRSFTWAAGRHAEILVPRRSRRDGVVDIVCQPNLPTPQSTQDMSVTLNGTLLGTVALREGWQTVSLPAPQRAWQIGINELTLSFSSAVSPLEAGVGSDARELSVAVDRVTVRSE
jgi:hypothetical protein